MCGNKNEWKWIVRWEKGLGDDGRKWDNDNRENRMDMKWEDWGEKNSGDYGWNRCRK